MAEPKKKLAVVTGGNKGIGLEICRQLANEGVIVVLTARNEKRGVEAVEKLRASTPADSIFFHQLDVTDSASAASLAQFVASKFKKLDILVNNAGIGGVAVDADALRHPGDGGEVVTPVKINWFEVATENYGLAVECIETNYFGTKRTTEALLPLLQLSDSPRIVNVSSSLGKLKHIPSEETKTVLDDAENLTEDKVDSVVNEFLKDFKEGSRETSAWPQKFGAYIVSKVCMNAYTRILARKYPAFRVNCVCPGYVKTDINWNTGILSVEEGAEIPVRLALLPDDGPSGLFFVKREVSSSLD